MEGFQVLSLLSAEGNLRKQYTYDHKNQLVRHDSATRNKSYTYTYDANGNILNKKEYPYTKADTALPEATDTIEYTYGDSSWGDLLTSYDGKEITYGDLIKLFFE